MAAAGETVVVVVMVLVVIIVYCCSMPSQPVWLRYTKAFSSGSCGDGGHMNRIGLMAVVEIGAEIIRYCDVVGKVAKK